MKTSTREALKAVAQKTSNVEAAIFTLKQLAGAVYRSEQLEIPLDDEQIEHVLDVALRNKLGLFCACGTDGLIDLGNGHVLRCKVEKL